MKLLLPQYVSSIAIASHGDKVFLSICYDGDFVWTPEELSRQLGKSVRKFLDENELRLEGYEGEDLDG